MTTIDLFYIIPMILLLSLFILIFIYGKRRNKYYSKNNILKLIPLLFVISLIFGILFLNIYYKKQTNSIEAELSVIKNKKLGSVIVDSTQKEKTIDSLTTLTNELKSLLDRVKKQEKITGQNNNLKQDIGQRIIQLDSNIKIIKSTNFDAPKSYNEIIQTKDIFKKGTGLYHKPTENFLFICPTDTVSEYLDLILNFKDSNLIDQIACILMNSTNIINDSTSKNTSKSIRIEEVLYKARRGTNMFRVKNYLKISSSVLSIGYILKSDLEATKNLEWPNIQVPWYDVTCRNKY